MVCVTTLFAAAAGAQEGVSVWVGELLLNKDDADPALVEKIAASRSREGAEGLAKAFDQVSSLLMRREIMGGLAKLGTVPEAEQVALQKLSDIAGSEQQEELRERAIAALGLSPKVGKHFLKLLVDSGAPDIVRQPALAEHVKLATPDDAAWYRHIWNLKQEQRKDAKGEIAAPELNAIRQLAFQGLLPQLSEAELVETLKRDPDPKIRRAAMKGMERQTMPRTTEMAQWLLERTDFPGVDRAEAARIFFDRQRAKAVPVFLDLAKQRDVTPEDLRQVMAELIAELGDEATDKKLCKQIGKGKPHEKVFVLYATAKVEDPKVIATIRKGLADPDPDVRRATADVLGRRRDRDSLPDLRNLMQKTKVPSDIRIALEAITAIEGQTSAWLKELAGYCAHQDRDVRNAAVEVLGNARDKKQIDTLLAALKHDDWSTRILAIDALAGLRTEKVVPAFIERMGVETGRMKKKLAEALWQLTAQPFDEDTPRWQSWWAEAGAKFTVATEKQLDEAEKARERRRLTERTVGAAKFFGLRVESHRVIFVIDVSGSMLESMYGRYVEKRGAARIDVAKQELSDAIRNLEQGALFNIMAFSSSVIRWQKDSIGTNSEQDRKEALEWVERLGANGATNLYDAVQMAFEDKDVDTIFIMSDGEPTSGAVIDPAGIRQDVAFWNKHRKVVINSIAIGGNLEVLEWLAKDSGGRYVQMR